MKYREEIHELVDKIKSERSLKRIYKLVRCLWMNEDEKDELSLQGRDGETNASDGKELQSCG